MPEFPRRRLLNWFQKERRDLPWRGRRTPYTVWISEILLQQTQVRQAAAYYPRFLRRFPTLQALAEAPLEEVLKIWEGLGCYARARNLHETAKILLKRYQGRIPDSLSELVRLPGIGRSTAGAILSLAFDRPLPVLDGNIRRVLIRFFGLEQSLRQAGKDKGLWQLAESILPPNRAGLFNEALMELGALVCLPGNPLCPKCPLKGSCRAFQRGRQHLLPLKACRKTIPHYQVTAAVIRERGRVLISQRPPHGLLSGLWEFPGGKREKGESLEQCLKREIQEELGIEIQVREEFLTVSQAFTHFRITLHCFFCKRIRGRVKPLGVAAARWIRLEEVDGYPFSRADRKVIQWLKERKQGRKGIEVP